MAIKERFDADCGKEMIVIHLSTNLIIVWNMAAIKYTPTPPGVLLSTIMAFLINY